MDESPALQNPSNVSLRQHSYIEDFIQWDAELQIRIWGWIVSPCQKKKKGKLADFHFGPLIKTVLPMQGTWVWSLVRELDPSCRN